MKEQTIHGINLKDLKIETIPPAPRSGQQSGAMPKGVRITHIPSGLVAECNAMRSQLCNRDVALAMIDAGLTIVEDELEGYQ